jgi:TrpR family transcriptional regulator, trp operon repressor
MHRNTRDHLAELSALLHQPEEPAVVERFLREILTPSEIEGISARWELVKRLDRGQSQRAIAAELGLSLCKITRGSRVLKQPDSALRAVLERQGRTPSPPSQEPK